MKRTFLIVALFSVLTAGFCCNLITSFFDEVEVGKVPQQVKDIFIESPKGIKVEDWQKNLEVPWSLIFFPNGDALVSERVGKIRLIRNGQLMDEPYAQLDHVMHEKGSEAGLMGLELHPDFPNQPFVYAMYTFKEGETNDNRIVRLRHKGTRGEFDKVIFKGIPASNLHNGGRIKFGPDNMLYITTGENFQKELAQDMQSLAGKILRITPEGEIPTDNPFQGSAIYSLGHRNPQGLDWHPKYKDLFSSEHGPSGEMGLFGRDIINIIYPGKNYGWPNVVGAVNQEKYEDPIVMWENPTPPSGIAFWNDDLFVATLRSKALIKISVIKENNKYKITRIERWFSSKQDKGKYGRLRDAVVGPDGALYVLTSNTDGRGDPTESDDRILRVSRGN